MDKANRTRILTIILTAVMFVAAAPFNAEISYGAEAAEQTGTVAEAQTETAAQADTSEQTETATEAQTETAAQAETVTETGTTETATQTETATKKKTTLRKLNTNLAPKKLNVNLRKKLGEGLDGYSVVQGSCTDGKYAYYLLVSTKNQKGRIVKVKVSNHKVVKRSKALNVHHGNGMAYDSKRKQLVVVGREKYKHRLTVINAGTLKVKKQVYVKFPSGAEGYTKKNASLGYAAIAYNKKLDKYVATLRKTRDFVLISPDKFRVTKVIKSSKFIDKLLQAMDADEEYIYVVYSSKTSKANNTIAVYDWTGKYIKSIKTKVPYEGESIYHIQKGKKEIFYMATYRSKYKYKRNRCITLRRDNYVYKLGAI